MADVQKCTRCQRWHFGPCDPTDIAATLTVRPTKPLTVVMQRDNGAAEADAAIERARDPKANGYVAMNVSEMFLHQLRLRVAQDPSLAEQIEVLYFDGEQRHAIGLTAAEELRWPVGFLHDGWQIENEILRTRRASGESQPHE
jgi:hypothetical protein